MNQRREHARRLLSAPATITALSASDAPPAPVHLVDISLSGVGFLHAGLLAAGEQYTLHVQLPGQAGVTSMAVTIVYCNPAPVRDFFRCGAHIALDADSAAAAALVDFLTTPLSD